MKKNASKSDSKLSNNVTFRLDEDDMLELIRRAESLGVSRHILGQHYALQGLSTEHDRSDLVASFTALADQIVELRKDLAIGVEALLLASGQYSEQEARAWVRSQFQIAIPDAEPAEQEAEGAVPDPE